VLTVYLAGPDVFRPDAVEVGRAKVARCTELGVRGRYPLDAAVPPDLEGPELARAIFECCRAMMDEADAAVVDLTPFRGVSADVGTAVELGYLLARGVPCHGHTDAPDDYSTRVRAAGLDQAGWLVEEFGLADNLMVEGALVAGGGSFTRVAGWAGFDLALRRAAGSAPTA